MNNHQAHLPTPDSPSHPRRYFQLDGEFRAGFLRLLEELPSGEIVLLDATGDLLGLNSTPISAALGIWLARPGARLKLCTFETRHIQDHSPSFQILRARHASAVEWRVAPEQLASRVQASAAASSRRLIKKPVRTAFHGFETHDVEDIAGHLDYFAQIWETCELAPPATPLGL